MTTIIFSSILVALIVFFFLPSRVGKAVVDKLPRILRFPEVPRRRSGMTFIACYRIA